MTDTPAKRLCIVCKQRQSYRYLKCKHCRALEERDDCPDCGGKKGKYSKRCITCQRKIRGKEHPAWKGGKSLDFYGYMRVSVPGHPKGNGTASYIPEHRHVMEENLGRYLVDGENVHHINGDRTDNRIENLELWNTSQPSGQRILDKLEWAYQMIELYDPEMKYKKEDK